jgi:predicted Rossmann fold flavoprotein
MKPSIAIIGGGAAGFFAAVKAASMNPELTVTLLEQSSTLLGKVKISGGGRCNVTHACYDVRELVKFYPRGQKELLGPFSHFACEQTIEWFEHRGVQLKTEADGRIFPVTDDSQTIIDCLIKEAKQLGVHIISNAKVTRFIQQGNFTLFYNDQKLIADKVVVATGSSKYIWEQLEFLGHTIIPPVPSLFTFNINHPLIQGLSGITLKNISCNLSETTTTTNGPVLITHSGLSGPAILKLSAFGVRILHDRNYVAELYLNWLNMPIDKVLAVLKEQKQIQSKKQAGNFTPFDLPQRFWSNVLTVNGIRSEKNTADLSANELQNIAHTLTQSKLKLYSKNTNKDEFVTAGGIDLKEVNFKTMESKKIPDLYFAGEVLDIDAVTGGFNFQAAWTTGYIAGEHAASTC